MSEPTDTPGVKKTTRRFAPVKRGGKSPAAQRRAAEAAAAAAAAAEVAAESSSVKDKGSEGTDTSAEASTSASTAEGNTTPNVSKSSSIGTIRPEASGSGRLQSVNDGQKTRGGTMKMKFKPTIPHKRNKKEVSSSAIDEALGKPDRLSADGERGGRGGRGGRGRGGRGRGRGRGLVIVDESTASGIFSLGPSAISRGRPGFGGGGFASYGGDLPSRAEGDDANTDVVDMFSSSVGKDTPVTFRHISRLDGDIDPVTLKQTIGKIPWMTVKSQKKEKTSVENVKKVKAEAGIDVDMDNEVNDEETSVPDTTDSLMDETEQNEEEPQELPKVYMDSDSPAQNIFALDEKQRLVCVAEEELLYFQLPTVIPLFESVKNEEKADVVMEDEKEIKPETATENPLPPAAKKSTLLEDAMANMGLEDIPDGRVGKLIVYKSGKVKMQFGSILLDVNQGMQSAFLENIMVVDHESEDSKKAIELGHIVQKFVCAPNMDTLLSESLT
ncbi:RNA polymerase III RPC4-domain-containing protein [Parasitella parasitica]|nr:RNA polymerase III RPC4-domain-containing protein [Parasitella parasitica]